MDLNNRKLELIQKEVHNAKSDGISHITVTYIQDILDLERFHTDHTTLDGYYKICDEKNLDKPIWVKCKEEYLDCIVNALNSDHELELLDWGGIS